MQPDRQPVVTLQFNNLKFRLPAYMRTEETAQTRLCDSSRQGISGYFSQLVAQNTRFYTVSFLSFFMTCTDSNETICIAEKNVSPFTIIKFVKF
jgi:hypothetical protein